MVSNNASTWQIINLEDKMSMNNFYLYISEEELIIFENHEVFCNLSLSNESLLKMKVTFSKDSKQIQSISLINQSSSFRFNFSHKYSETLDYIFMVLKRKITMQGFNLNFKIKKMLGEGSFGKVYLVKNILEEKLYAVKYISKNEFASHKRSWIALSTEIKVLKKLNHQNMVCLDSIYEEDDAILIVMDYLPGGTLQDFIQTHGVLTEKQSVIILETLLKMLKYLNGLGIMHRDLKPENIMLREPTISAENIVLIDFGFSVFMSEAPFEFKKCGTPGFIAPEILHLKNYEPMYGPKSDIFSVGIIWYYCLFGSLPYKAKDSKELLIKNKIGEFSFENSSNFQKIEKTISKLLQKKPEDRVDLKTALEPDFFFHFLWDDDDIDEIDGELPSKNIEKLNNLKPKNLQSIHNSVNLYKAANLFKDFIISEEFPNKGALSFLSSGSISKNSTMICNLSKN